MAPAIVRSAAASIIADPVDIRANAKSLRAPPAAMSARTCDIRGASGVRSKVNFIMLDGVRMNGSSTLEKPEGSASAIFLRLSAKAPVLLVNVWYSAASVAARRKSSGGFSTSSTIRAFSLSCATLPPCTSSDA